MHEKGKSPEGELSARANTLEGGQDLDQSSGCIAESNLEQNRLNSPRIGLETGSSTGPEPFHRVFQQDWKACLWTHLLHGHGSTKVRTSLIKFCLTLIQECKLDPNLKISLLSMLFSLILSQKMLVKLL
uniref:Uncharacterized protein n=1 Tax=Opuntia streptacantha TaxID=393608 RepID=A0A7C9DEC9_OPUST